MVVAHQKTVISLPIVPTMKNASTGGSFFIPHIFSMQIILLNLSIVPTLNTSLSAIMFIFHGIHRVAEMGDIFFLATVVSVYSDEWVLKIKNIRFSTLPAVKKNTIVPKKN